MCLIRQPVEKQNFNMTIVIEAQNSKLFKKIKIKKYY